MSSPPHPLETLREKARLQEYRFTSSVPVIGGLIARFREAWNSVATKWYVRPLIDQQTAFNLAVVDQLAQQQEALATGSAGLEAWLIDEDREQTRLTRQVAELALRTRRLAEVAGERRLRLAFLSPLPPARSGIADYSAELLPRLAQHADMTLFVDEAAAGHEFGLPTALLGELPARYESFDLVLYQMGNSAHHDAIYDLLVAYPGVVVLHDATLHHFIRHHTRHQPDLTGYGRELAYAIGPDGWRIAEMVQAGEHPPPYYAAALNERLVDVSLGLITHSEFAAAEPRRRRPEMPLAVIPALVEPRPGHSRRTALGIPPEAVLFGSFGQITAEKQIEFALRAFRRTRDKYPRAHFLLVGEEKPDVAAGPGGGLAGLVTELGLDGFVHHVGYVDDLQEFVDWIHSVDVVVNLRFPTAGETSATALRAMAAARPLIVFNIGWYQEIPEPIALKVTPEDEADLVQAMRRLAGSSRLRQTMGTAGETYAREVAHPDRVAQAYIDFLRQVVERLGTVPL